MLAVDPSDPNTIYINGDEPDLYQAKVTDTSTGKLSFTLLQDQEDVVEISFDAESTPGLVLVADRGILLSPNPPSFGSFVQKRADLGGILLYDLAVDPSNVDNVFGVAQDQFNILQSLTAPAWQLLNAGSEIGTVLVDPNHSSIVYAYGPVDAVPSGQGIVSLSTDGGASFQSAATGIAPDDYSSSLDFFEPYYRAIAINSLDSADMIVGSFHIYESLNAGTANMTWKVISPDLTNGDHINDFISSVAIDDVNGVRTYFAGTISGKLWVGTLESGGASYHWTEIDGGVFTGTVGTIAVNPQNAQEIFAQVGVTGPGGVWHTLNQGKNWTDITGNLPDTLSANALAVDWRFRAPQIYLGASRGVYRAQAAGAAWQIFANGMPPTDLNYLEFLPAGVLAASSYGNGAFEVQLPAWDR